MDRLFDKKMLRQYVKRQISGKNSVIAALSHKFNLKHAIVYRDIYSSFIKGDLSSSYSDNVLRSIYNHIEENHTKKYTPYNYFDLDTLISFNSYLEHILEETDANRIKARRSFTSQNDFLDAIKNAPQWLIENAGTEETGYYNINKTIGFLMLNGKYFMPEKAMSKAEFEKKYNSYFCKKELAEYLGLKYQSIVKESKKQNKFEQEDEEFEEEKEIIEYDNKSYYVVKKDYYFDKNMFPVKYIIAYCEDGKDTLIGALNLDNTEYFGDLYDNEGNYKMSEEETGIELIRKNTSSNKVVEKESHPKPKTKDQLIDWEDDDVKY